MRKYAHIGSQSSLADAWFDTVKHGRTRVTNGPRIEFTVNAAMPGNEVLVSAAQVVRVKAKAWCDPQHMTPATLQFVRNADVIRSAYAMEGDKELAIDFWLPTGTGFWIAARATCGDGSQAHTTPVYVIRRPLRFWKHAAVDELIRKRLPSLREVEEAVATARELHRDGRINYHRPGKQFSLQSADLLTRVAKAREFYKHLSAVAANERATRIGGD